MTADSSHTIRLKRGEMQTTAIRIHNPFQRKANTAVEIAAYKESLSHLSKNITISIRQSPEAETLIYGPATLEEFAQQGYTVLETLEPGELRQYAMQTSLHPDTVDAFQDHLLTFDLRIGTEELLPPSTPVPQITSSLFSSPSPMLPANTVLSSVKSQQPLPTPQVLGVASRSANLQPPSHQKPLSFLFVLILFVAPLLFLLILRDYIRHRKQP